MKRPYRENAYNYFKRQGYGAKYEFPGIYCIKIDNTLVYVGKSFNMLKRISEHYAEIHFPKEKKYELLFDAATHGHLINFDVLYYAKEKGYKIEEEIGQKEGELIRRYMPALNTQIPKKENWRQFKVKPIPADLSVDKILKKE